MSWIVTLLSPPRRTWILSLLIAITFLYSWSAVNQLRDLVAVQQQPEDVDSHSLLDLAEQNIASHLHIQNHISKFASQSSSSTAQAITTPSKTVATNNNTQQQQDGNINSKAAKDFCAPAKFMRNTDFWGDALVWGYTNKAKTAEECCAQCANYKPTSSSDNLECNVWVFCEDKKLCGAQFGECWIKHLAHPEAVNPSAEGPNVGYTTGILTSVPMGAGGVGVGTKTPVQSATGGDRKYHVVITAQGPAVHWQSRVCYYWYKKIKKACEEAGPCDMGGFTRILHSGHADELVDEIPTFIADPLPPEHPNHGYIVLNRPYAFKQWLEQTKIPERYVLMSEPDHLWLKPMPNLMNGETPAAFPFFYIEPSKKEYLPITQKFLGPLDRKEAEKIAPIGNAPTMVSTEVLEKTVPLWYDLALAIHNDEEASKAWGWVQEMYAFTMALYKSGVRQVDLHLKMMGQPPWDTKLPPYHILHFTYGMDYTKEGKFTPGKFGEWRFDKRTYATMPPPRHLEEPPENMTNELVRQLIRQLNEATDAIPGWDEYQKTGRAMQLWDGKL
jgi:hydroxyproline O-arabinosyltransferase